MTKKKILISIGTTLFLIAIALILIWHYQSRPIEPELVSPTEISPVKIPASAFIEHISESPDGGGTKIYERAEQLRSVSERKASQEILPANTFIDHTAKFSGDTGTAIYPPVPEVQVGPIVPPSTMIDNVEEFPQE